MIVELDVPVSNLVDRDPLDRGAVDQANDWHVRLLQIPSAPPAIWPRRERALAEAQLLLREQSTEGARVQTIRLTADCSREPPPPAETKAAVEQAQDFVAAVRRLSARRQQDGLVRRFPPRHYTWAEACVPQSVRDARNVSRPGPPRRTRFGGDLRRPRSVSATATATLSSAGHSTFMRLSYSGCYWRRWARNGVVL